MPNTPFSGAKLSASLAALSLAVSLALTGCGAAPQTGTGPDDSVAANADPISTITGDAPNFAQLSNGSMMTVVSRDFGRGAKAGALVELYYPHYSTDHLWDSYVGVRTAAGFNWAHQLKLTRQRLIDDTGICETTFQGPSYRLVIADAVRPGVNSHLRHVTLTNLDSRPLVGAALSCYAFFTLNTLPGGDRLRYDPATGGFVQTDDGVAVSLIPERKPSHWQCGVANLPASSLRDARQVAEGNAYHDTLAAGPVTTGINASMENALPTVAPGASVGFSYAIAIAPTEAPAVNEARSALATGWAAVANEDASRWAATLADAKMPSGVTADAMAAYRRAVITLHQHVADNGAIIAAPTNLDPPYRFVWPRDGSLIALTLAQTGDVTDARRLFEFLEHLQKPDGGWAVNYFPDGKRPLWDFGTRGNEHDEVATFCWGVQRLTAITHDNAWLSARWPAVRKACEFLLSVQDSNGLLNTCRDLWELDKDGSWTYSDAAGWAGLTAGAAIADQMGQTADAARYRDAAKRLHDAMERLLVTQGYFARGLRKGGMDPTAEIANFALGSAWFGAFADTDPRMKATADRLTSRLKTPWGGMKRYEGDRYYDGQPWPVATGWLGLYQLGSGDRAGARAQLDVMTRYAGQTESRMLGEQFDETNKRWVSAFPLAWSEANYVRLALDLSAQ